MRTLPNQRKLRKDGKNIVKNYMKKKDNTTYWNFQLDKQESPSLTAEMECVMKDTTNQKAPGPDGIQVEIIKNDGESTIKLLHQMCYDMEDWKMARRLNRPFIHTTVKKGDIKQCSNYRAIALVSLASKIILRIILERIHLKTDK